MIVAEVTLPARSQMNKCRADVMNRFLLTAAKKKERKDSNLAEIIVEGFCDFSLCLVLESQAVIQSWSWVKCLVYLAFFCQRSLNLTSLSFFPRAFFA